MNQDQEIRKKLLRPSPPADLELKIRNGWQQQLSRTRIKSQEKHKLQFAFASTVMTVVVVSFLISIYSTPDPIAAALRDIEKDKNLNIGVAVDPDEWFKTLQINKPPQSMKIKLSKQCKIGVNHTLHLQIAGAKQGSVHFFIHQGDFNSHFWQIPRGEISSLTWQIITPRKNLSVIVMRTENMNPGNVEKLVHTMFYS